MGRPVGGNLALGHKRGFTLVELLVTAGLLIVVLGLLFIPVSNSLGYFRTASARADAQAVARGALEAIAREVAEAMFVQLDMYDNTMLTLVPPLRLDPNDPNSEIVTPPRPDLSRAVRFWRALNDPTRNYTAGSHLEAGNTFFVARTVVPDPLQTGDPWNRWNRDWAEAQSLAAAEGTRNWSPIPRATHTDFDYRVWLGGAYRLGARNNTLQPGYPYLYVLHKYGAVLPPAGVREYRNAVVALTPNAPEFDITQLTFDATAVAGEQLRPADGPRSPDYSLYRARYPLWRLGYPYTGWSVLASMPTVLDRMRAYNMQQWARDPFLLIYRWDDNLGAYPTQPTAIGAFDPRTRTMKVIEVEREQVYDTGTAVWDRVMPATRIDPVPWFGFTVDWVDGSLRFDFPVVREVVGARDVPLGDYWQSHPARERLDLFVLPDSVMVFRDDGGKPGKPLRRVHCTPREGRDEFQLGLDPASTGAAEPLYGWIRLPETLAGGVAASGQKLWVSYRWRNNGVVPKSTTERDMTMADEHPDLIVAYYRTAAVLDIGLAVTRADPSAPAEKRIAQTVYMTRRVKLRNLLREIRYGED